MLKKRSKLSIKEAEKTKQRTKDAKGIKTKPYVDT